MIIIQHSIRIWLMLAMLASAFGVSFAQSDRAEVTLTTSAGNIVIALYNETPVHRDNFLKLVSEKAYDGLLFHRVIQDFMVQAGDPNSWGCLPDTHLGDGDIGDPLPAEILFPQFYHRRGALAAARQGDDVNPLKRSSGSQFYIVWGKQQTQEDMDRWEHRLDSLSGGKLHYTKAMRDYYTMFGGTPHLDSQYTVFGEVIKGLESVYKIQRAETNEEDRPVFDIVIKKARITKKPTKKM